MRLPVAKRVGSAQVPAVDEGLEDVLLDGEVAVGDGGHSLPQVRQRVNGLGDAEVPGDVVRGRLGTEPKVVADVLLDGAVPVVAADDRIRPVPGRVLTEDPLLGPRTIKGSRVHDARGPTMHSADRPRHSADDRPIVAGVSRAFSVPFQLLFSTLSAERTHVTSLDHRPGLHPTFTGRRCRRRWSDRQARRESVADARQRRLAPRSASRDAQGCAGSPAPPR